MDFIVRRRSVVVRCAAAVSVVSAVVTAGMTTDASAVRSSSAWTQQVLLKTAYHQEAGTFGIAVAMSGNTLVVGETGSTPRAYVHTLSGSSWTLQTILSGNYFRGFGSCVSVAGDVAVIGSSWGLTSSYIFKRSGTTWTLKAVLHGGECGQVSPSGNEVVARGVLQNGGQVLFAEVYTKNSKGKWIAQALPAAERDNSVRRLGQRHLRQHGHGRWTR